MTPDQERWAEALMVEKLHGDQGHAFIASRIVELGAAQDWAGVERWRQIAWRLQQLEHGREPDGR